MHDKTTFLKKSLSSKPKKRKTPKFRKKTEKNTTTKKYNFHKTLNRRQNNILFIKKKNKLKLHQKNITTKIN